MIHTNLLDLYASITLKTDDYEDGIDRAIKALSGLTTENKTVETSVEKLQKAFRKIEDGTDGVSESMDDAADSTDDLADAMDDASDKSIGFADVLKANLLGNVIVSGVKALGNAVKNMAGQFIESAASVKAESSQFEQTFGEFQDEATEAIGRVASESGVLDTRLKTLGSRIFAFARSSGGEVDQSMSLMERALRVAADSAAYYDTSVESATETLQSFLKGNYENDAALGLSATETTRNAAAMELFGMKFNELTEIQKQETLLKMVEDSQKLSGAMGQAARESDGWENVMGNLTETWRQFQAKVGEPVLENLIPIVQDVTTAFQGWMENVDWNAFGENIDTFVTTMIDNGPVIISLIAGIAGGFVAWNVVTLIQGVVSSIKAFKAANEGATIAQLAMNAAMNANPIGIVITVVMGLVAAIGTLYATNENFRNFVQSAWATIKDSIANAVTAIVKFFTETIPDAAQQALDWFKRIPEQMWNVGVNIVTSIWNGIASMWNNLVSWFNDLWNSLFGGRSVNVNVNRTESRPRIDGSHAGGLRSVPFDGYIAELHKGERVLTAREATRYQNPETEQPIHITVQSVLDGRVIGESTYKYIRNKKRALGV